MEDPPDGAPDPTCVLMLNTHNGFNELSCKAAFWRAHQKWPVGAQFVVNCYQHSAQLIVRCKGKPSHTILSAEGVTQGDPLLMVLYGLALIPLVDQLAKEVPGLLQPWYANDAVMAGPATKSGRLSPSSWC